MPKQQPDLGLSSLLVTKGAASAPSKTIPQRETVDEVLQPMNFKVPSDFHREFKTYAVAHGLKMNQLLFRAFETLKKVEP